MPRLLLAAIGELLVHLDRPEVEKVAPGTGATISRALAALKVEVERPSVVDELLAQADRLGKLERRLAEEIRRSAGLADDRERLEVELRRVREGFGRSPQRARLEEQARLGQLDPDGVNERANAARIAAKQAKQQAAVAAEGSAT